MLHKHRLPDPKQAIPGRSRPIKVYNRHYINGNPICPPFPENMKMAMFGLGCFWGAEQKFWQLPGVYSTAVGYAGGYTPNPLYEEVCSGMTAHNEVVRVIFAPGLITYAKLLTTFWESHDPTQGMRQGNDTGTQYRSGIYVYDSTQQEQAHSSCKAYQLKLTAAGFGSITTEIANASEFYYAEDYHQQYLAKNPAGYCGLGGTGINCGV